MLTTVIDARRLVYIITSIAVPDEYYVGVTSDVDLRLRTTKASRRIRRAIVHGDRLVVIEFDGEEPALKFERYLKSGSGREFARRHVRQTVRSAHRATAS